MASTYTPIATTTLGSAGTTVDFTSISGTYTDLVIVIQLKGNAVNTTSGLRFNSDTASNYSATAISGDSSGAFSWRNTSTTRINMENTGASFNNVWGQYNISIQNYANATTYKSVLIRSGAATGETNAIVGLWRKTPEAITSINLYATSGSWAAGSTFTLYGIKAA